MSSDNNLSDDEDMGSDAPGSSRSSPSLIAARVASLAIETGPAVMPHLDVGPAGTTRSASRPTVPALAPPMKPVRSLSGTGTSGGLGASSGISAGMALRPGHVRGMGTKAAGDREEETGNLADSENDEDTDNQGQGQGQRRFGAPRAMMSAARKKGVRADHYLALSLLGGKNAGPGGQSSDAAAGRARAGSLEARTRAHGSKRRAVSADTTPRVRPRMADDSTSGADADTDDMDTDDGLGPDTSSGVLFVSGRPQHDRDADLRGDLYLGGSFLSGHSISSTSSSTTTTTIAAAAAAAATGNPTTTMASAAGAAGVMAPPPPAAAAAAATTATTTTTIPTLSLPVLQTPSAPAATRGSAPKPRQGSPGSVASPLVAPPFRALEGLPPPAPEPAPALPPALNRYRPNQAGFTPSEPVLAKKVYMSPAESVAAKSRERVPLTPQPKARSPRVVDQTVFLSRSVPRELIGSAPAPSSLGVPPRARTPPATVTGVTPARSARGAGAAAAARRRRCHSDVPDLSMVPIGRLSFDDDANFLAAAGRTAPGRLSFDDVAPGYVDIRTPAPSTVPSRREADQPSVVSSSLGAADDGWSSGFMGGGGVGGGGAGVVSDLGMGLGLGLEPANNDSSPVSDPRQLFDIGERLGEGSFGDVFRAVDRRTHEAVAVKISKRIVQNEAELVRLRASMNLLDEVVPHPNLVRIHECRTDKDGVCVVEMDLCDRGTLSDYVNYLMRTPSPQPAFSSGGGGASTWSSSLLLPRPPPSSSSSSLSSAVVSAPLSAAAAPVTMSSSQWIRVPMPVPPEPAPDTMADDTMDAVTPVPVRGQAFTFAPVADSKPGDLQGGELPGPITPRGSKLSEARTWEIAAELANALRRLHSNGLVHMDVKPDNVLVTSSGSMRLGDFGLLVRTGEQMMNGDSRYLAPELLHVPDWSASPSADMFALGMTIFELVYGVKLPSGGTIYEQLRSGPTGLAAQMVSPVFAVPPAMARLIVSLLSPAPEPRPSAADVLAMPEVAAGLSRARARWASEFCDF